MTTSRTDVVVVGAGFAGLTIARELSLRGWAVQVVEARDRIGGRTWTTERLGRNLDLGGSYVHWLQPHVWTEITRYGLELSQTMEPVRAAWVADGAVRHGAPETLNAMLDRGNVLLLEEARRYFERPYEPLSSAELDAIDARTVADVTKELDLTSEERGILDAFWALNFSGPIEDGAFSQALRWGGVASGSWSLMFEACGTYKFRDGTRALAEAMAAEARAELRLGETVQRIDWTAAGATTTTDRGELESRFVVVTAPLNVLGQIEFSPPLSPAKRAAAQAGQVSQGVKAWARVRGRQDPFVVMGEADWPITLAATEYYVEDDTLVVAFGARSSALDPNDPEAVAAALHRWLPDLEVVGSAGHDWVADPFARETWSMSRPGQLTSAFADLRTPEGPVHIAGGDYANGWAGFIDGAIESGLAVSRVLMTQLEAERGEVAR